MGRRDEAAGQRHGQDRLAGLGDELPRAGQPALRGSTGSACSRGTYGTAARAAAAKASPGVPAPRRNAASRHAPPSPPRRPAAWGVPRRCGSEAACAAGRHGRGSAMDELLRHRRRQRVAVLGLDQVEHHVKRRGAARAGEAVAVDDEDLARHRNVGERLREGGRIFPMQRAAATVEQTGAGKDIGPRAQRPDVAAGTGKAAEPGENRPVGIALDIDPRAHDRHAERLGRADRAMRHHRDAVAGGHRLAIGREQPPAVQLLAAQAVGGAQRLDRGGERHHREIRDEQEADRQRPGGHGAEHDVSSRDRRASGYRLDTGYRGSWQSSPFPAPWSGSATSKAPSGEARPARCGVEIRRFPPPGNGPPRWRPAAITRRNLDRWRHRFALQ